MVGSGGVVVAEPGVGLGLELLGAGEESPVEGGSPAFFEHGLVEPFDDGVVVGGAGWDATMRDLEMLEMLDEASPGEFATIVREERRNGVAAVSPAASDQVNEADGDRCGGSPHGDPGVSDPAVGIDCGELPHLADAFEFPDVEAVETDQDAGSGCP